MGKYKHKKYLEIGEQFSQWTVLGADEVYNRNKTPAHWKYICQCSCDKKTIRSVARIELLLERSKSCGCSRIGVKRGTPHNKGIITPNDILVYDDTIKILFTDKNFNLTGKHTLIDKEDYEKVKDYRWHVTEGVSGNAYAETRIGGRKVKMHRVIMDCPDDLIVDHIDGNGLHNVKSNLRLATYSNNCMNRRLQSNNSSGYVGVLFHKQKKKWEAFIQVGGQSKYLGAYNEKEEAIKARKEAELEYFGEYSYDNSRGKYGV